MSDPYKSGRQGETNTNINPRDNDAQAKYAAGLRDREQDQQRFWNQFNASHADAQNQAPQGNSGLAVVAVLLVVSVLPFVFLALGAAIAVALLAAFTAIFASVLVLVIGRVLLNNRALTLGSAARMSFFAVLAFAVIAPVSWFCALVVMDLFVGSTWVDAYRTEVAREAFNFVIGKEVFAHIYGTDRLAEGNDAAGPVNAMALIWARLSLYLPALLACAFILRPAVGDLRGLPRFPIALALALFVVFVSIGIADLAAAAGIRWLGY